MVTTSISAYKIRAPRQQMLLFSVMVLQNYPLFKYSRVTREKEIKPENKDNNPKVDQPKNRRRWKYQRPHQEVTVPFMSETLALIKSVTTILKEILDEKKRIK